MATATDTAGRVLLYGISWSTYEALLEEVGDRRIRLTYDKGDLEIMSPSGKHERVKRLLARMVDTLTEVLSIPVRSAGSTTFKKRLLEKGLEPDECYYLANEALVRQRDDLDLDIDPPPDLAIEVDVTRSCLDRMGLYAALGVPEVWRFAEESVAAWVLGEDGCYTEQETSRAFPFLTPSDLDDFLARRDETDETTWIRAFREWVRERFVAP